MRYVIWYYLFNLKNVKNAHAGACKFTKSNTPPWVFSRFLNCTNGAKWCKTLNDKFSVLHFCNFSKDNFLNFLMDGVSLLGGCRNMIFSLERLW